MVRCGGVRGRPFYTEVKGRGQECPRHTESKGEERLRTTFGVLRVHTGVYANDQQSHQNRADQHDNPDVEAGVKCPVANRGSEQARRGADGAESEIEFFHPSAGNDEEPQKNGGDDGKDSAENPRATGHRGQYPDAGGGLGGKHLPDSNQEEHDGMHQGDDGAFAVGENGKSAHA